jgi:hypothetical protein
MPENPPASLVRAGRTSGTVDSRQLPEFPHANTVEEASNITLLLLPELLHVLVGAHFDWKKDKSQSPNLERMNHDDQRTMPIRYLAPKNIHAITWTADWLVRQIPTEGRA